MTKLDAMIAPRALTAREIAEVAAPQIAVYAIAHRAFTHAMLWTADDAATTSAAESALDDIVEDGVRSVGEWLSDMEGDGEPRFYRKASVKPALLAICRAAANLMCQQSGDAGVAVVLLQLESRDGPLLERLINAD